MINDNTVPKHQNNLNINNKKIRTQHTTLIQNNVLIKYLQNKLNTQLINIKPTNNKQHENFAHIPIPRITNTFMLPKTNQHKDLITSINRKIYTINFNNNQINITNNKFVFSINKTYIIKNNKITYPIKKTTLIKNNPNVLKKITNITNNLSLNQKIKTCNKKNQSIPINIELPSILINNITINNTTT